MPFRTSTRRKTRRNVALRGALAIIECDGRILLQKRSEHRADPGTWVIPGGAIMPRETVRETLVRVCAEELGVTVRPHQEIGAIMLGAERYPVWQVLWKGKELTLGGSDIAAIGWFTVEELLQLEPVRHQKELRSLLQSAPFFIELSSRGPMEEEAEDTDDSGIDEAQLQRLVERSKDGDHDAFGNIYDLFITPIYRYVSFRVPAAHTEDLVSDIFVKAWEKLNRYHQRRGTPFSSWLFRIAGNVVIDWYRTSRNTEELHEIHIDDDRWNDPTLSLTQEIQSVLLRQSLSKLPRRSREVILLSFMSNLSNHEIAKSLHMREGSVRIVKHRALKKLKTLLPASMREELP